MGILNITPDSFSDGGEFYNSTQKAVKRAEEMLTQGADIIDIGGESTRPGAETVDAQEESKRVIPVIKAIKKHFPKAILSIDTWKHEVADEALQAGCTIVNSLGGFTFDGNLVNSIVQSDCKIIIYHIKGTPETMQKGHINYTNVTKEITHFFEEQITIGKKEGIKKDQFILDPGIGFGKTVEQNIDIIKHLAYFKKLELPIAIGVSRKSYLGKIIKENVGIETNPTERVEAGLAATAIAVINDASIVRTHDVLQTKKFLAVFEKSL